MILFQIGIQIINILFFTTYEQAEFQVNSKKCLLIELIEDGETSEKLFYNEDDLLVKRQFDDAYILYLYNDLLQLEKQEFYESSELDAYKLYYYNESSKITKIEELELYDEDEGFELDFYTEYEYNAKGQISKSTEYALVCCGEFNVNSYTTYVYDNVGNLVKAENSSACCGVIRSFIYKYDNKTNPFSTIGLQIYNDDIVSPNNRIKTTVFDKKDKVQFVENKTISYNEMNLPKTVNTTISTDKHIIKYKYKCN